MLASRNRLRKPREISRVYRRGNYGGSGGVLSVKAAPGGGNHPRLVVVVGRKVDKRAVVRNRIRRRIQAIVSAKLATLKPGYDIVISVHKDVSESPRPILEGHLASALEKARVIGQ